MVSQMDLRMPFQRLDVSKASRAGKYHASLAFSCDPYIAQRSAQKSLIYLYSLRQRSFTYWRLSLDQSNLSKKGPRSHAKVLSDSLVSGNQEGLCLIGLWTKDILEGQNREAQSTT